MAGDVDVVDTSEILVHTVFRGLLTGDSLVRQILPLEQFGDRVNFMPRMWQRGHRGQGVYVVSRSVLSPLLGGLSLGLGYFHSIRELVGWTIIAVVVERSPES